MTPSVEYFEYSDFYIFFKVEVYSGLCPGDPRCRYPPGAPSARLALPMKSGSVWLKRNFWMIKRLHQAKVDLAMSDEAHLRP